MTYWQATDSVRVVDSDRALLRAMNGLIEHHQLPKTYTNSLVKREVVEEIKGESRGRSYHDMTPDAYSSFVIAKHLGSYVSVDYPVFWTNTSPVSAGLAISSCGTSLSDANDGSICDQHLESERRDGKAPILLAPSISSQNETTSDLDLNESESR